MNLALVDAGLVNLLSLIVTGLTAILLAWIAFKQASLSKTVGALEKNTNSMREALVESTAAASKAEGKVEGRREFERENKPAPAAPGPKVAVDFSAGSPGHITVVEEPPKPEAKPKPEEGKDTKL